MDDYWKKVYEECGTPSHKIVSRSCFKNLLSFPMIKEMEYFQAPQRVNGDVTNVR